jgi:hypothetical protein
MALLQKGYLGATPLFKDILWYEGARGRVIESSAATTVTANTSAHTKGSYSELIASTASNASMLGVWVTAIGAAATNTATLLDLAIGAASSESDFVSNIAVGAASGLGSGNSNAGVLFHLPIKIPSGSRLSARIQSVVTGGKTATVRVFLIDAGDYNSSPTSLDSIGTDTADSAGVTMSGASGTWNQAIASTSRAYRAVAVVPSSSNATNANITIDFDVGVGASGSEQAFGTMSATYNTNEFCWNVRPELSLFGRNIPSGSRLAVRHNVGANPERYDFCLIGIP